MNEIWLPVSGYEGMYEVSNFGRVRSIAEKGTHRSGRVLIPYPTRFGYLRIQLCKNGKKERPPIHRLVAIHFISEPPHRCVVNHIDFNPANNHVSNLEWVTHQQNILHSKDRLCVRKGVDSTSAKLTESEVISMRAEYAAGGISFSKLAKKYGICPQQCHRIIRRERWAHI